MRRIKEVLRLRYELKLDQRQIARSCSLSVSTVHEYLKRAEAADLGWPLPEDWDDARVETALFRYSDSRLAPKKSQPDFAAIQDQLRRHRHLTLQLLWQEVTTTRRSRSRKLTRVWTSCLSFRVQSLPPACAAGNSGRPLTPPRKPESRMSS